MMTKGSEIRFIAGKYAGKKGWIDLEGDSDSEVTSVIVNLGGRKGEKSTYVYTSSIRMEADYEDVKCYAKAIIHQCPDIEKDLVTVCRKFAKSLQHEKHHGKTQGTHLLSCSPVAVPITLSILKS